MEYKLEDVPTYIKTELRSNNTISIVAEPGDATRYELWITRTDSSMASICGEQEGCHLITCLNLSSYPSTMFVRPCQFISWKKVRDELGITAEGSAYFITILLAHFINTFYEPYETFIAKLEQESRRT